MWCAWRDVGAATGRRHSHSQQSRAHATGRTRVATGPWPCPRALAVGRVQRASPRRLHRFQCQRTKESASGWCAIVSGGGVLLLAIRSMIRARREAAAPCAGERTRARSLRMPTLGPGPTARASNGPQARPPNVACPARQRFTLSTPLYVVITGQAAGGFIGLRSCACVSIGRHAPACGRAGADDAVGDTIRVTATRGVPCRAERGK